MANTYACTPRRCSSPRGTLRMTTQRGSADSTGPWKFSDELASLLLIFGRSPLKHHAMPGRLQPPNVLYKDWIGPKKRTTQQNTLGSGTSSSAIRGIFQLLAVVCVRDSSSKRREGRSKGGGWRTRFISTKRPVAYPWHSYCAPVAYP